MATAAYDQILSHFGELTAEEQERIVRVLTEAVACHYVGARRSVMELRGLGKDVWRGVDATDYVREERSSWRG